MSWSRNIAVGCLAMCAVAPAVFAQEIPSQAEMWEIIQRQQAEIEALKEALGQTNEKIEETEVQVIATADAVEEVAAKTASADATGSSRTHLGGYGEVHYNNLSNEGSGADLDRIDVHRFVMFLNHEFSDSVRFFSELEVEHSLAGDGEPGEVELEQAYVEWDINDSTTGKAGLFLIPVGILNETHEPNTFYGVERNNVENRIVPTTWWEAGGALSGEISPGLNFDVAVHSGLFMESGSVRGGRQKVAQARADDFAYTGRLRYTAIPGLEIGGTLQIQTDVLQGETIAGASDVGATLFEAHATYQSGPFALRALYATWDIDNDIEMISAGADSQEGWYLEPSYRLNDNLGFFLRASQWDNNAGNSSDSEYDQIDIGLNYWMTDEVVFKADYQDQSAPDGASEFDGFNLGIGWAF